MVITSNILKVVEAPYIGALTHEDIAKAYFDVFQMNGCTSCGTKNTQGMYDAVLKKYNQYQNLKQKLMEQNKNKKYAWNPQYAGITAFVNGVKVVYGSPCEDSIMEIIFNDPNRVGVVIKIDETPENTDNAEAPVQKKKSKK